MSESNGYWLIYIETDFDGVRDNPYLFYKWFQTIEEARRFGDATGLMKWFIVESQPIASSEDDLP